MIQGGRVVRPPWQVGIFFRGLTLHKNFGSYRDECVTNVFRDYDSVGAIVEALTISGPLKMLLLVDRHKLREGDKPAKNVRHRWQLVTCDDNQRYCRTFRSRKDALRQFDALTYKR